jgi:SnoaL-like domain
VDRWTGAELSEAFARYQQAVTRSVETADWEHFVQCFSPDATYVEHAYGRFAGHDEIRRWVKKTMGTFPGNHMVAFPPAWSVVDAERGWVVCEIRNLMRDPGDSSVFEASNITILRYAGDRLWAEEEDVYNPQHFLTMVTDWMRRSRKLDTLPAEASAWAQALGIEV